MSTTCMGSGGVVAVTEIPSGTKSAPFPLAGLAGKVKGPDLGALQVRLSPTGEMTVIASNGAWKRGSGPWVKEIQLAPDCQVQNVRLCRWEGDTGLVQATRHISAGNPLFLWFGEDMLLNTLGISPYLSPHNIRGGTNYVCHKCGSEFEAPNPLKVHLALACGSLPVETLWARLSHRPAPPAPLNLHIPPSAPPFLAPLVRAPYFLPPAPAPSPPRPAPSPKGHLGDHQAHLESIMSNMGRGKNGHHVCIYCGKLYSRKYGLKIHLRTHTGYKPLQCKICKRPFGDPSNLNKHVRLHSEGTTPYRCEFCGKVLVRRRDLDRHIRSRHPSSTTSRA